MLAKSETASAVLRAKPNIADQRVEAGAIARGLTMLFQIIFFLRPVGCGHRDGLADRSCGCARAIVVPVERLLLTPAPSPIARGCRFWLPWLPMPACRASTPPCLQGKHRAFNSCLAEPTPARAGNQMLRDTGPLAG